MANIHNKAGMPGAAIAAMTRLCQWMRALLLNKGRAALLCAALALPGCEPAPVIGLADGSKLAPTAGQVLVINYWAKWCKPCRHEIPELNQLDQEPNVQVIGIDFDQHQGDALTDLMAEMGIEFAVLDGALEPALIHPKLSRNATALPMTYLLQVGNEGANRGRLSEVLMGPQTKAGLLAKIKAFNAL